MSTADRSLARLPLHLFENLATDGNTIPARELREQICASLDTLNTASRNGSVTHRIRTVGPLLQCSAASLVRTLDPLLTYEQCNEFMRRLYVECSPSPLSAFELLHSTTSSLNDCNRCEETFSRMRYLPTGLEPLDQALRGGVRVGTITELVGPPGVGKTQLAMQLCIMASRYAQGCVYVDTEKKLSVARLREIALQRSSRVPDTNTHGEFLYPSDTTLVESTVDISATSRNCFRSPQEVLDNVTVHSPSNIDELFGALSEVEDELFSRNHQSVGSSNAKFPVRLLVLDSIAAPARRDFGAGSAPELASTVIKIAQTLKRLADQHHLVVVVINQVGSSILGTDAVIDQTGIRPALGTSWHHCVSTRVLFEFEADLVSSSSLSNSDGPLRGRAPSRQLSVIKSNLTGPGKPIVFDLTLFGIVIKA